jgi:hypothetical protein
MGGIAFRIVQPRLQQLHAYWQGLRKGDAFPSRRDIDPASFRFVLGHVFLVAIEREPTAFRYRLFGVNLARRAGYEMTGKTVDEIPADDMREFLSRHYAAMLAHPAPILERGERALMGTRRFELLLLPLAEDGKTVDMILGALLYADPTTPDG